MFMKRLLFSIAFLSTIFSNNAFCEKGNEISDYYAVNCKKNSWSPQLAIGSRRGVKAMMETQTTCKNNCNIVQDKQCGDFALFYKKKFRGVFVPRNLQKIGKLSQNFVKEFKRGCNKFVIEKKCQCCKMGYTLYQTRY